PMSLGPLVCATGIAMLAGIDSNAEYWVDVFPGLTIFALGLALLVAPLTATVLAAAPDRYAGVASGVNNAVARAGSLLAVAALPAVVGLSWADHAKPEEFSSAYRVAMLICAFLLAAGALVSWLFIRNPEPQRTSLASGGPAGWSNAGSDRCPGAHQPDEAAAGARGARG